MRIVHVIVGLDVGGAEHMLRRLVLRHRQSQPQTQVTVVTLKDLGTLGAQMSREGINVVPLKMRSSLELPATIWRLRQLLCELRPEIVQTWMVHADLVGGLAARWAGIRNVVWGVRTTDYSMTPRATQAVHWLCARLSRHVPRLIVCAAEASRRAHAAVGYDASRMLVISNGFDISALQSHSGQGSRVRAEAGLSPQHLVIGCVGRYNAAKDHGNFVDAAAFVAQRDARCRFLMVGRDVERANVALWQRIEATGLADRFVLLGERRDVAACLDAMDVFVLSSRNEGFPNVVGEAMAMGVPCVVTDVGDAALLVGSTGVVVPPHDPAALAQGVLHLIGLPATDRQALGQHAQQRVCENFSMEHASERFAQLYSDLMNNLTIGAEAGRCAG